MIEKDDTDIVDEMLENNEEEYSDPESTVQIDNAAIEDVRVDTVGHPLNSYDDPVIGSGGRLGDRNALTKKAREYAKKIVHEKQIPVNLKDITWESSSRMSRSFGVYKPDEDRTGIIRIAEVQVDAHSMDTFKRTIRHELVHAWQHQTKAFPRKYEDGTAKWTWHGPSFKQWLHYLDINVREDAPATNEYKYEVYCPNCGMIGGFQKNCKSVRHIVNKGLRSCVECGEHTRGELWVEQDGIKLHHI